MTAFERELVENGCEMQDMVKRLQNENAELRECLESCMKAMCKYCRDASPGIVCFHGCEYLKQAKAALEGGK